MTALEEAGQELGSYAEVSDGLVLEALDRADAPAPAASCARPGRTDSWSTTRERGYRLWEGDAASSGSRRDESATRP